MEKMQGKDSPENPRISMEYPSEIHGFGESFSEKDYPCNPN